MIKWLKENWLWIAPSSYAYVTYVGMVQSFNLFKEFDLSIFEFAELNDFLLAAFQDPKFFLFVLLPFFLAGLFIMAAKSVKHWIIYRGDHLSSPTRIWLAKIILVIVMCLVVLFLPIHAQLTSKQSILLRQDRKIRLLVERGSKSAPAEEWIDRVHLIGTTEKYLFAYQPKNQAVMAVPISKLKRIEFSWHKGLGFTPAEPDRPVQDRIKIENYFTAGGQKPEYELIHTICCFDPGKDQLQDFPQGNTLDRVAGQIRGKSMTRMLRQVVIVGGVDKTGLSPETAKKYGSNLGLAQARAEWVARSLKKRLDGMLNDLQVVTLVAGPKTFPDLAAAGKPARDHSLFSGDRSVRIYGTWTLR